MHGASQYSGVGGMLGERVQIVRGYRAVRPIHFHEGLHLSLGTPFILIISSVLIILSVLFILLFHSLAAPSHGQARGGIVDPTAELGELHCLCGEVVHLCFVVHGIGQAQDLSIHKSTDKFRSHATAVMMSGRFGEPMKSVQLLEILCCSYLITFSSML